MAGAGAGERRRRLAAVVAERGFVRVKDVSDLLGVSEVTIRGDLDALEVAQQVMRVHGGAVLRSAVFPEPSLEQSRSHGSDEKRAIGTAAAALVSSGQSVLLDVGSTALAAAEALVRRTDLTDLTVITNGLSIALALEEAASRFSVVVTGGTLRPLQHSLVNPGATDFLESVHADIALIGCNGVDVSRGVTNINFPEAEVKRRMLRSSARAVLLADATKLGRTYLGVIGAIDEFDELVTAGDAPHALLAAVRNRGVNVILLPGKRV